MEDVYTLRLFEAKELEEFDILFARMAPDTDPAVMARRRWWCFDNPRGGVFALFHNDNQIAATCYLGGKRLFGDPTVGAFEIGETATDPRHQRRGLFSKLVRACVLHGALLQQGPVYGTPNSQSTPGYAKLGFTIVNSSKSWLFVIANPLSVLKQAVRRQPIRPHKPAVARYLITAEDYIAATSGYERLNVSDREYMTWRLGDTPMQYRFARISTSRGAFECAVRTGQLGRHDIVVVAEYFLNGKRPRLGQVASLLRRSVADLDLLPGAAGIYVHGERPSGIALALLYAQGIIPHRILPICAIGNRSDDGEQAWFRRFQLSDCDIG